MLRSGREERNYWHSVRDLKLQDIDVTNWKRRKTRHALSREELKRRLTADLGSGVMKDAEQ